MDSLSSLCRRLDLPSPLIVTHHIDRDSFLHPATGHLVVDVLELLRRFVGRFVRLSLLSPLCPVMSLTRRYAVVTPTCLVVSLPYEQLITEVVLHRHQPCHVTVHISIYYDNEQIVEANGYYKYNTWTGFQQLCNANVSPDDWMNRYRGCPVGRNGPQSGRGLTDTMSLLCSVWSHGNWKDTIHDCLFLERDLFRVCMTSYTLPLRIKFY